MDATAWDERYAASRQVWSAAPDGIVETEVSGLRAGLAVDLACGEGRHAVWLARSGWLVHAVDFSAVAVARGRALAPDVDWAVDDVLTAPLPGQADLALLAYLQLPAPERRAAVRRAWGSLAVGGRLVLVAHDTRNLAEGVGGPQAPDVLYSADDVLEDLAGLPVTVHRAERVARVVASSEGHGPAGTALDAVVVVQRRADDA